MKVSREVFNKTVEGPNKLSVWTSNLSFENRCRGERDLSGASGGYWTQERMQL